MADYWFTTTQKQHESGKYIYILGRWQEVFKKQVKNKFALNS